MGNKALDYTALTIALIGAVNWGLVGFFNFNLVSWIFSLLGDQDHLCAGRVVWSVSDYILLTFRQRGIKRTRQDQGVLSFSLGCSLLNQNRQQAVSRVILKMWRVRSVAVSVSAMERLHGEEIHYESRTIRIHIGGCRGRCFGTWRMHGRRWKKGR